jgi:integrase/recombinase XerD
MKQKSKFSAIERANLTVEGFSHVFTTLRQQTALRAQSEVSIHSLRHSYATHLLENGLNIVTIKELLGHVKIETTMIYLHVAHCPLLPVHSPLDTLYPKK